MVQNSDATDDVASTPTSLNMMKTAEQPSPASANKTAVIILFSVWWLSNNLYAIDSELFFHSGKNTSSPFLSADLAFAQCAIGLLFIQAIHMCSDLAGNFAGFWSEVKGDSLPAPAVSGESVVKLDEDYSSDSSAPLSACFYMKRNRIIRFVALATVHLTGALLTAASYATLGASSTLVWKLTEPLAAIAFKSVVLRSSVSLMSLLAVGIVFTGAVVFSSDGGFGVIAYGPIISSNLIFPLRNALIKLDQNDPSSNEDGKMTRQATMLLFGLPVAAVVLGGRFVVLPIARVDIWEVLRNACLFNMYQFASVSLLSYFDTVAHSLLNTFKRFTGILVTMVVLQKAVKMEHGVGIGIAFVGFMLYVASERKMLGEGWTIWRSSMQFWFVLVPVCIGCFGFATLVVSHSLGMSVTSRLWR